MRAPVRERAFITKGFILEERAFGMSFKEQVVF